MILRVLVEGSICDEVGSLDQLTVAAVLHDDVLHDAACGDLKTTVRNPVRSRLTQGRFPLPARLFLTHI